MIPLRGLFVKADKAARKATGGDLARAYAYAYTHTRTFKTLEKGAALL